MAVNYILKNWTALMRYYENPDLAIDNNRTERSLRGWAVGRNNWTFFGPDRGGHTAVLRSFAATCELAKVDPFAWFNDVLSRIAQHPINQARRITSGLLGAGSRLNTLFETVGFTQSNSVHRAHTPLSGFLGRGLPCLSRLTM